MKFTLSWLKQFLDTDLESEEICNALTAIGLEVEEVVDKRDAISCFKVAQIKDITKHPEADKLNICKVDNGKEILQIICGAQNVKPNMKIVLASIGDVIPSNGLKIEKIKLRGVESQGMICSAEEIGLEKESDGILELPQELIIGKKLIDQIPELVDEVIEISLTPNRGDCFGVYGIARDLSAYGVGKLRKIPTAEIKSTISNEKNIIVDDHKKCHLYVGRYFAEVSNKVSPLKLSSILKSIDEQSISALVDITNYLMFSYSRPMHIYDADKIVGDLVVRNAKDNEKFIALDGKEYSLTKDDLVIADSKKVCALAGIIGGEESKCDLDTKNILLEVAVFDKKIISRTARRLGIETSSKHRNERGIDYNFTIEGAEIASQHIIELCGGQAGDIKIIGEKKEKEKVIDFDMSLIEKITGIDLTKDNIINILNALGLRVISEIKNDLKLSVPSWRHDINISEDVVEEVIRIYGYDKLKATPLYDDFAQNNNHDYRIRINQIKKILSATGYNELVTWSFMSSKISEKYGFPDDKLKIKNPISDNLDQLRYSIIPNLLQAVKNNKMRSFDNLSFFEIGPVYHDNQKMCLVAVRAGENTRSDMYGDKRNIDFFDLKKDMLNALKPFGIIRKEVDFVPYEEIQLYHPGKSAKVVYKGKIIGNIGETHPSVLKMMKISGSVAVFELFIDEININTVRRNIEFSDYQLVEKDIAFVVDKNILAGDLEKAIYSLDNIFIKDFYVFDVYSDEDQLGKNKKSIAIKMILQADDKTLSKEEIDSIFKDIIDVIAVEFKGELRTF